MRPAAMTAIVVLLVSVTGGTESSSDVSQPETALSSQSSRTERQHRHRHGYNSLRLSSRRRRPDPLAALPLPADLQESEERVELEHGRRRYADPSGDFTVCCPAVEERTSPKAGKRRDGRLALLYASDDFRQVFFERSCESPGRQPRRRHRCVQEYSYSYAVLNLSGSKVLDMIRIRSGCRCEVKRRGGRRRRKKKRDRDRKRRAELRRRRRRQRGAQSQTTNARNAS